MKKATIQIEGGTLIIDGIRVTFDVIPQFLYEIAHPDPRKWYRFERVDDELLVHVIFHDPAEADKPISLEEQNGHYVRERGRGSEDAGSEGQKAPHPHDEHRPN